MKREQDHPPLFDRNGKSLMAQITPDEVARYVVLAVRDPLGYEADVAQEIAAYLDDPRLVADTHMFVTYTGTYEDVPVTVCSTGSGAPETELALVDFFRFSRADTFVRAGTSGTYLEDVEVGDLVIASAAVRDEGTSAEYVASTFPAVASYDVLLALADAAERSGFRYHIGITRSNDSCHVGQGRPVLGYWQAKHQRIPEYWTKVGVKNFEREASLTFVLCALMNRRVGAVNAVVNSMPRDTLIPGAGAHETFVTVLEGIKTLSEWDETRERLGKRYWLPSMEQEE